MLPTSASVRLVAAGPAMSVHVGEPARSRALRDELNAGLTHARAYLREDIPARLRVRGSPRIGDILVIPDGLGLVGFRRVVERVRLLLRPGMHGWDPRLPEMHGIFLAAGPGIAAGVTLPPVDAVDVYPLVSPPARPDAASLPSPAIWRRSRRPWRRRGRHAHARSRRSRAGRNGRLSRRLRRALGEAGGTRRLRARVRLGLRGVGDAHRRAGPGAADTDRGRRARPLRLPQRRHPDHRGRRHRLRQSPERGADGRRADRGRRRRLLPRGPAVAETVRAHARESGWSRAPSTSPGYAPRSTPGATATSSSWPARTPSRTAASTRRWPGRRPRGPPAPTPRSSRRRGRRKELAAVGRRAPRPTVANMVERGRTPLRSREELAALGFRLILYPLTGLLAAARALETAYGPAAGGGRQRRIPGRPLRLRPVQRSARRRYEAGPGRSLRRRVVGARLQSPGAWRTAPNPRRPLAGTPAPRAAPAEARCARLASTPGVAGIPCRAI